MDLFVYDNSPNASEENHFQFHRFNITYVHDPLNAGVSKAYNSGAQFAEISGKEWILLLDQDTSFPEGFVYRYQEAAIKNPGIKLFCPILKTQFGQNMSPCLYLHKRGRWVKHLDPGIVNFNTSFSPVNSGMMINLAAFNKAGGYKESVRLDFADFQFIERFKRHFNSFFLLDLVCLQDFSGFEKKISVLSTRFKFFCEGARNCDRNKFSDRSWYLLAVIRRLTGLIVKTRSIKFIRVFFSEYLFKK